MNIGNQSTFAIESHVLQAFQRPSFLALGSFTIHIDGLRFGVTDPDATMMALSLEEVDRRLRNRGTHKTPFTNGEAAMIADAYRHAFYGEEYGSGYPGMGVETFVRAIRSGHIQWAPDGDEAFDDSSYILHFDDGERVRLLAFKLCPDGRYDPSTLKDIWLAEGLFYAVLGEWRVNFLTELASLPKADD